MPPNIRCRQARIILSLLQLGLGVMGKSNRPLDLDIGLVHHLLRIMVPSLGKE